MPWQDGKDSEQPDSNQQEEEGSHRGSNRQNAAIEGWTMVNALAEAEEIKQHLMKNDCNTH